MNNQAFSKIWIVVILMIFVAGGFFAWQYFGEQKKEGELITPAQAIIELMEMLEKEVERKAEKEGIELFKITEEKREELKEEIRQKMGQKGLKSITKEELEELKTEMKGVIYFMVEVLVLKEKTRIKARDVTRKADMRMIVTAQEMYYGVDWHYYQSDGTTWPSSIGTYMVETPTDPLEDTKTPYVWVDNTGDDQKFCVYATLEEGGWYAGSHKGIYECSDTKPTPDDCCF